MHRKILPGIIAFVLIFGGPLLAHDFSTSYSLIEVEGTDVRITLTFSATDFHSGPQIDLDQDGRVDSAELEEGIDALFRAIRANYQLGGPGPPLTTTLEEYSLTAENVARLRVVYEFGADVTDLRVVSNLDRITQENHQHLLQIGEGDEARTAVLDAGYPDIDIDYATGIPFWVTIFDFVELGIEHIFTGYDHLAFLVALLMATTTLLSLTKIVTCFTIGHSVTLVLATLGVVVLPSRLIESLIALSIAYVAIENFIGRNLVHRWMVTSLFGLVHGFGFSNVLREMGLGRSRLAASLFSFNFGVEIGQLIFVAVLFPLLLYIGRSRWKQHVMSVSSVGIMCLGFYWFVLRAFLA